jgi:hypothetical protein
MKMKRDGNEARGGGAGPGEVMVRGERGRRAEDGLELELS